MDPRINPQKDNPRLTVPDDSVTIDIGILIMGCAYLRNSQP